MESNLSVFDVSVFYDSVSLCLLCSVSLCLWEERCSCDVWLYFGRISGISPRKVPNSTKRHSENLFAVHTLLWSLVCLGTCSRTFSRTSSWTCPGTFSRTFSGCSCRDDPRPPQPCSRRRKKSFRPPPFSGHDFIRTLQMSLKSLVFPSR